MSWSYCCCEPEGNLWIVGGNDITKWDTKHAVPYSEHPSDTQNDKEWRIEGGYPDTWAANGHSDPHGHACDQSFFYLLTTAVGDGHPYDFRIAVYDKGSGAFVRFIDLERGPNHTEHLYPIASAYTQPILGWGVGPRFAMSTRPWGHPTGALLMSANRIAVTDLFISPHSGISPVSRYRLIPLWDHSGALVAEIDIGLFYNPIWNRNPTPEQHAVLVGPYMDHSGSIYIVAQGEVDVTKDYTGETYWTSADTDFPFDEPTELPRTEHDSYKFDGKISKVVFKFGANGSKEWEADIETTTDGTCSVYDAATAPDGSTYVWVEQSGLYGSSSGTGVATPPHCTTSPQHIAELHKIDSGGSSAGGWPVKFCYTRDTYYADIPVTDTNPDPLSYEESDGSFEKPFFYTFNRGFGGGNHGSNWKIGHGGGVAGSGLYAAHSAFNNGPTKAPSPDIERIERHSDRRTRMWTAPDSSLWILHDNRMYNYPSDIRRNEMWDAPDGSPVSGDVANGGFDEWYSHFNSSGSIDWVMPLAPEEEAYNNDGLNTYNGFDSSGEFWHNPGFFSPYGSYQEAAYVFKRSQDGGPPTRALNITETHGWTHFFHTGKMYGDVPTF